MLPAAAVVNKLPDAKVIGLKVVLPAFNVDDSITPLPDGSVNVPEPATAGACIVIAPLVLPLTTTELTVSPTSVLMIR
jgi:hypothetical protein